MALEVLRVFQEVTGSLSGYSDSNKATADGVGWGGRCIWSKLGGLAMVFRDVILPGRKRLKNVRNAHSGGPQAQGLNEKYF